MVQRADAVRECLRSSFVGGATSALWQQVNLQNIFSKPRVDNGIVAQGQK
jgi:hypothetical protein